jgi:SAM-dependent methyltransferase
MEPDLPLRIDSRVARERTYWNDVYQTDGTEHHKYVWVKHVEGRSYVGQRFLRLATGFRRKLILSLGGGIDSPAVALAKAGNRVVSVDISPVAAAATVELARQEHVAGNLTTLVGASEDIDLNDESFDVVLSKRALHHMDVERTVARIRRLLVDGGMFLAEEPICLSAGLEWVHRRFPFHPSAPRTPDERELTQDDLSLIRHSFREVRLSFFDCLTRESVAYVLARTRMDSLLNPLGRLDYVLLNKSRPILRRLATYAIVEASK